MRRSTRQSLILSVSIHIIAVVALLLAGWVHLDADEEPVVFELVTPGDLAPPTAAPPTESAAEPSPEPVEPLPDLAAPTFEPLLPAPADVTLPEPTPEPPPVESPKPAPQTPPQPATPAPKQLSYKEWLAQRDKPLPDRVQTRPNTPRKVNAPSITAPDLSRLRSTIESDRFDFNQVAAGQRDALQSYFSTLVTRLRNAFEPPSSGLEARVSFTVASDGSLQNVRITRSSGDDAFDLAVKQAFARVRGPGAPPGNPPYNRTLTFTSEG